MIIKKMKLILPLLLVGVFSMQSFGQDWHWSQYYASPLTLNPAMTGFYNGNCRATGNFRQQWGGVYSTYQASYEHRFHNNIVKNELFDAGLVIFQDNQGSNNAFSALRVELSLAYTKKFNENHSLTFALQPSYGQTSFTAPEAFMFSDNLADVNFAETDPVAETPMDKIGQFDFATGLLWSGQVTEKMSLYSGLGLFHLAGPTNDYLEGGDTTVDESVAMKIAFHGGGRMSLGGKLSAIPNFIFLSQSGSNILNLGSTFEYAMPAESSLKYGSFGFHFRNDDAVILLAGMGYKEFNLGLSYDLTYSAVSTIPNGRNALEFSLIYICPVKEIKIIRAKPCPRF